MPPWKVWPSGLPVLAKGIEFSPELGFLSDELCLVGQGYVPGDHMSKFEHGTVNDAAVQTGQRAVSATKDR